MKYKIGDKVEFVGAQKNLFGASVFKGEVVGVKGLLVKKYRILYKGIASRCEWLKGKDIIRIAKED